MLDVTISSNLILDEILGIKDLRSDKRIDFVGGIRGLGELKKRVDSGEMKMALALYPVSMKQLMDIADTGNIMPPKTTWLNRNCVRAGDSQIGIRFFLSDTGPSQSYIWEGLFCVDILAERIWGKLSEKKTHLRLM